MDTQSNLVQNTFAVIEKVASWIFLAVIFLLPIFFIPSLSVPFQATKTLLLIGGTLVALLLIFAARLREGKISLPTAPALFALWGVGVAYLLSALFSEQFRASFLGFFFEVDTAGLILILVLFATIIPYLLRTREALLRVFMALMASFAVLALFQLLRLFFGPEFLSLSIFTVETSNLIGKWNDLAIFFGFFAVLALFAHEELSLAPAVKWVLRGMLALSLFFLAVVNFSAAWFAVAAISALLFAYKFFLVKAPAISPEGDVVPVSRKRPIAVPAIIVCVVALVFAIGGNSIGNFLSNQFGIAQIEARPSWQSTLSIARDVVSENIPFGSGPNTFAQAWSLLKPSGVNTTIFWNTEFRTGIGLVPTSLISTGVIGLLAWLLFFGLLLWSGFRSLVRHPALDRLSSFLLFSTFLGALYLWIFVIVYTPGVVLLSFAFAFTGMYIAALRFHGGAGSGEREITFNENPRLGFAGVFSISLLLVLAVGMIYVSGQRYVSTLYFQQSVVEANVNGDLPAAREALQKALALGEHDSYFRLAADLNVAEMNQLLSDESIPLEERRLRFQDTLSAALQSATRARDVNPNDYQNWVALGRVYQFVVPLQVEGSYDEAKIAYGEALLRSPNNPGILLLLAELEAVSGNLDATRAHIAQAIEQKPNYIDAYLLLAQIELNRGDLSAAIPLVEQAAALDPQNPVVFYQLGVLYLNNGDTERATLALGEAVVLNPVYANARYFLGAAYAAEGRFSEALSQFEKIKETNPDNPEVERVIAALRAGENPFETAGAASPEDEDEVEE